MSLKISVERGHYSMTILLIIIFIFLTLLQTLTFLSKEKEIRNSKILTIVFFLGIYHSLNHIPNETLKTYLFLCYGVYLMSLNIFIILRKPRDPIKNVKKNILISILSLIFYIACILLGNKLNFL